MPHKHAPLLFASLLSSLPSPTSHKPTAPTGSLGFLFVKVVAMAAATAVAKAIATTANANFLTCAVSKEATYSYCTAAADLSASNQSHA